MTTEDKPDNLILGENYSIDLRQVIAITCDPQTISSEIGRVIKKHYFITFFLKNGSNIQVMSNAADDDSLKKEYEGHRNQWQKVMKESNKTEGEK